MSKSAFEKWDERQGYLLPECIRESKSGWLAALKWALRQKFIDPEYPDIPTELIDPDKIKSEIRKVEAGK